MTSIFTTTVVNEEEEDGESITQSDIDKVDREIIRELRFLYDEDEKKYGTHKGLSTKK